MFAAWAISKFRFHGKKVLVTLIDLPVTVSPIIAGLIFVLTFGRQSAIYPLLESIDLMVVYAVPGIILATVFVTFPFISREILPVLEAQEDWSNDVLYETFKAFAEREGLKNGQILWPLRTAVSGKQMTPGGATELMELLGKEESIARVRKGVEVLKNSL